MTSETIVPAIVAHRGYAGRYPENTWLAIDAALRAGVRHVEIDVQSTADGVPVLMHDEDLRRTTGRPGRITALSFAEVARLRAGEPARFGTRFRDTPVPALADLTPLFAARADARLFVEVKPESAAAFGAAPFTAAVVRALAPCADRCVVISFVPEVLHAARAGGMRIGRVLREYGARSHAAARDLAPDYLFCNRRKLRARAEPWPGPWEWVVYEVTDPAEALALAARGFDMIETMRLDAFSGPPWNLKTDEYEVQGKK